MSKNVTISSTGIIRRFDDLGRIVIPKTLRDNCGFKEGAPAEIFATPDGVYLQLYTPSPSINANSAFHWVNNHKKDMETYGAKFSFDGRVTTCEVIKYGQRITGKAICDPKDKFDFNIGVIYSFCRATSIPLPSWLQ